MTQAPAKLGTYRTGFEALRQEAEATDPQWLRDLRQVAWSRFNKLGFPTARRGNEKWKYTNVRPLAAANFGNPPAAGVPKNITVDDLRHTAPWNDSWTNLVFLDGHFARHLSSDTNTASQVGITSLADAIASENPVLQSQLAKHATVDDDGFTALNTAFLRDGALIDVPAGHIASDPVHLIFVTTGQQDHAASYPRTLLIAGANSRVTVLESYVSLAESSYFTNAVTEFVLEDGSQVEHYRLLLENADAFHVGTMRVQQGKDSSISSASFARGAAMARQDVQVTLDAPGASCSLNGLYMTAGEQHIDNLINIDHAQPYTKSRLFYKGILDGKSKAVFGGTVLVRKDAQKTDAQQTDKNLLLSREAEVDSKPSLLIYADDVQCSHGATAGHIDKETLFYMQSRGLDRETASRILIHAFASQIIDTVELEPLRDYLDDLFLTEMPTASLEFGDRK